MRRLLAKSEVWIRKIESSAKSNVQKIKVWIGRMESLVNQIMCPKQMQIFSQYVGVHLNQFLGSFSSKRRHEREAFKLKRQTNKRCRHSSVVSSSPTILRPRVRIPSTPSTLFSICIEIVTRNNENKQKRGRDWPIFLTVQISVSQDDKTTPLW